MSRVWQFRGFKHCRKGATAEVNPFVPQKDRVCWVGAEDAPNCHESGVPSYVLLCPHKMVLVRVFVIIRRFL